MARTANIDFNTPKHTDPAVAELIKAGQILHKTIKKTIAAADSADGKEHPYEYDEFVAKNRGASLALTGGKEENMWAVISEYVTKRSRANAYQKASAESEGPERAVNNAVRDLLKAGLRDTAILTVSNALYSGDNAKATEHVAGVEAKM